MLKAWLRVQVTYLIEDHLRTYDQELICGLVARPQLYRRLPVSLIVFWSVLNGIVARQRNEFFRASRTSVFSRLSTLPSPGFILKTWWVFRLAWTKKQQPARRRKMAGASCLLIEVVGRWAVEVRDWWIGPSPPGLFFYRSSCDRVMETSAADWFRLIYWLIFSDQTD